MLSSGRSAPRTHAACLTCKRRRVKCDLTRPSCTRCRKAGKDCDGYQFAVIEAKPGLAARDTLPPHSRKSMFLLSAFRATQSEWQAYSFYNHRVASVLGGAFDRDIWQKLILQVADVEPTVRHGLFALGNLFRHRDLSGNISDCVCVHCSQALRHCNKSISAYSTYLQKSPPDQAVNVALVSCLTYICLESYRMNKNSSIALIARGCSMIEEASRQDSESTPSNIDPRLVNMFDRLWLLSSMFGHHVPRPAPHASWNSDFAHTVRLDTIEEARDSLHNIITFVQSLRLRAYQVHVHLKSVEEKAAVMVALQQEQGAILALLKCWEEETGNLISRRRLHSFRESQAWYVLRSHYLISKIRTATTMNPAEVDDESQVEDFQSLVNLVEDGLTKFPLEGELKSYSFEPSFLPALFVTACKCRHPNVRRTALDLLCLAGETEGLWNRDELRCVAARVIELEEGLAFLGAQHLSSAFYRTPLRFYEVLSDLSYRENGKTFIKLTYLIHDGGAEYPWQSAVEILPVAG